MSEEPKDEPRADSPCSSRSEELGNFDDNSMMMDSTETKVHFDRILILLIFNIHATSNVPYFSLWILRM